MPTVDFKARVSLSVTIVLDIHGARLDVNIIVQLVDFSVQATQQLSIPLTV